MGRGLSISAHVAVWRNSLCDKEIRFALLDTERGTRQNPACDVHFLGLSQISDGDQHLLLRLPFAFMRESGIISSAPGACLAGMAGRGLDVGGMAAGRSLLGRSPAVSP